VSRDQVLALLMVLVAPFLCYFGPRLIGMGSCRECNRGCAPWDAFCMEHRP
jgi:hypothetical protein